MWMVGIINHGREYTKGVGTQEPGFGAAVFLVFLRAVIGPIVGGRRPGVQEILP
jgi:hypothetical protein